MMYFDYNATAPIIGSVQEVMAKYAPLPLNASAVHKYGREAKLLIEESRLQIARLIDLDLRKQNYNITFCSSATEANNLVINGDEAEKIAVSAIEHPSILNLARQDSRIDILPVSKDGIISMDRLAEWLKQNQNRKLLISLMMANNETGIIQPIADAAKLVHAYGGKIHTDMVQVPGKMKFDISNLDIDYITLSSHKIGGPLGIGALIHKEHHKLKPQVIGGGQEKGLRSGTENTLAIIGFGKAAEILSNSAYSLEIERLESLRDYFEARLTEIASPVIIGRNQLRLANTSLLAMPGKKADIQLIKFDMNEIAVSAGSACSSGKIKTSSVLSAMSIEPELAASCIRYSFGSGNSKVDIDKLIDIWRQI